MKRYRVIITPTVLAAIEKQAEYIAKQAHAPLHASRWFERVFAVADSLAEMPERFPIAEESTRQSIFVRRVSIDGYFLLFTIDEQSATVAIVAARHGRQLPLEPDAPE
jgi:plasmid stabilization system protein ParE